MRSLLPYLPIFAVGLAAWSFALGQSINSRYDPLPATCMVKPPPPPEPLDTCRFYIDTLRIELSVWPDSFARVSWVETANGLVGVGTVNNLFGMRAGGWGSAWESGATPNGFADYKCRLQSVRAMAEWIRRNPPIKGEDLTVFLGRRKWIADTADYRLALNSLNH